MMKHNTSKKARVAVPNDTESAVLIKCRRRCCLCFGIDQDDTEKEGQIAHLDGKPSNNREDNLVWLCQRHHSLMDSTTSQHKNYTVGEVKHYRAKLVDHISEQAKRAKEKVEWRAELERKTAEHHAEVMQRMADSQEEYNRKQHELQIEVDRRTRLQ